MFAVTTSACTTTTTVVLALDNVFVINNLKFLLVLELHSILHYDCYYYHYWIALLCHYQQSWYQTVRKSMCSTGRSAFVFRQYIPCIITCWFNSATYRLFFCYQCIYKECLCVIFTFNCNFHLTITLSLSYLCTRRLASGCERSRSFQSSCMLSYVCVGGFFHVVELDCITRPGHGGLLLS